MEVTEQLFQHPKAHGFIGECLYHLGMPEQAAEALRLSLLMAPKDGHNRRLLVNILREDLKQEAEAQELEKELPDPSRRIVVVSGLPRSGTSMMMQMLERGGVEPLTDEVRAADASNPHGYYEFEKVKNLANDASFMPLAEGKAIKVIAQLLPYLPARHTYKVIWMEREISEVIMSQQIMLGKTREQAIKTYPFKLAQTYFEQLERVEKWIENQPHVDVLRVQFADAHNHPGATARRVAEFLDMPERAADMEKAVDNALYRNQQS